MICNKCGFKNDENLEYCGNCGSKLGTLHLPQDFLDELAKSELESKKKIELEPKNKTISLTKEISSLKSLNMLLIIIFTMIFLTIFIFLAGSSIITYFIWLAIYIVFVVLPIINLIGLIKRRSYTIRTMRAMIFYFSIAAFPFGLILFFYYLRKLDNYEVRSYLNFYSSKK